MTTSPSDADMLGFCAAEIAEFLAGHGILLQLNADAGDATPAQRAEPWPSWQMALAALPLLTFHEAASALAGLDPHAPGWPSDEECAERARWETALERSAQAGELSMVEYRDDEGNDRRGIRPADFAAWCARVPGGLAYPLPGPPALPATDPALREALAEAESARAELAAQVARLQAERDRAQQERDALRRQAASLTSDLHGAREALARLARDREVAAADDLAGKSRTQALRIIGALAVAGHGLDIHADRLEGIGRLRDDLIEAAGVDVDEGTLRKWLRAAAQSFDPPRKR